MFIRLVLGDDYRVRVTRQRQTTRCYYVDWLARLACGSPHVDVVEEGVEVVGMFGDENRVPDVQRYRVCVVGDCIRVTPNAHREVAPERNRYADLTADGQGSAKTVALVLESPHATEYCRGDRLGHPIAPAQGTTGARIDSHLEGILNAEANEMVRDQLNDKARVLLVEPIPFQTSLAAIHGEPLRRVKALRDAVWKTLWDVCSLREDFRNRLQLYRPDIIVNCCTYSLKDTLTQFLQIEGYSDITFDADHPSSWTATTTLRHNTQLAG